MHLSRISHSTGGPGRGSPPPEFVDRVRDALLHVYDVGYLQAHPLRTLVDGHGASGPRLRQALLDAIEAARPGPEVSPTARAWRLHHILELRYVECHDVAEVMEQVALSSAQYHREHQRALQMVAVTLWERWHAADRWPVSGEAPHPRQATADLVQEEAQGLVHDRPTGRVDLAGIVQDLDRLLRPLAGSRGVELRFAVSEQLPPVAGERVAVRQLFLALLSHAVDAADGGAIEVTLAAGPRQVLVTIAGPATSAHAEFELGMREGQSFVQALQGTLTYSPAGGARGMWEVQVVLPAYERPALLVVDNSPDFVRLVELYLTGGEWEVIGAGSVDEAIGLARRRHPNLILLDVIIPGRDGWDLLLALRDDPVTLDIPVIVCSVLHEPQMAIALGAAAYLQKPVSQGDLMAALGPFR